MGEMGKGVNNMVTDSNYTYCADQIVLYTYIELLCCTPEASMLYTNFILMKNNKTKCVPMDHIIVLMDTAKLNSCKLHMKCFKIVQYQ